MTLVYNSSTWKVDEEDKDINKHLWLYKKLKASLKNA